MENFGIVYKSIIHGRFNKENIPTLDIRQKGLQPS